MKNATQPVFEIKATDLRYLNEFTKIAAAPDMLLQKLFPNAKEITESFGAYHAVRKHLTGFIPLNAPDVHAWFIGDGSTPRTAATFAFRSAWQCHSLDPGLNPKWGTKSKKRSPQSGEGEQPVQQAWSTRGVFRLRCWPIPVENLPPEEITKETQEKPRGVIILVHAHVTLEQATAPFIKAGLGHWPLIAMPCCVKQRTLHERQPDHEYRDWGIWSPHNTIRIWKRIAP